MFSDQLKSSICQQGDLFKKETKPWLDLLKNSNQQNLELINSTLKIILESDLEDPFTKLHALRFLVNCMKQGNKLFNEIVGPTTYAITLRKIALQTVGDNIQNLGYKIFENNQSEWTFSASQQDINIYGKSFAVLLYTSYTKWYLQNLQNPQSIFVTVYLELSKIIDFQLSQEIKKKELSNKSINSSISSMKTSIIKEDPIEQIYKLNQQFLKLLTQPEQFQTYSIKKQYEEINSQIIGEKNQIELSNFIINQMIYIIERHQKKEITYQEIQIWVEKSIEQFNQDQAKVPSKVATLNDIQYSQQNNLKDLIQQNDGKIYRNKFGGAINGNGSFISVHDTSRDRERSLDSRSNSRNPTLDNSVNVINHKSIKKPQKQDDKENNFQLRLHAEHQLIQMNQTMQNYKKEMFRQQNLFDDRQKEQQREFQDKTQKKDQQYQKQLDTLREEYEIRIKFINESIQEDKNDFERELQEKIQKKDINFNEKIDQLKIQNQKLLDAQKQEYENIIQLTNQSFQEEKNNFEKIVQNNIDQIQYLNVQFNIKDADLQINKQYKQQFHDIEQQYNELISKYASLHTQHQEGIQTIKKQEEQNQQLHQLQLHQLKETQEQNNKFTEKIDQLNSENQILVARNKELSNEIENFKLKLQNFQEQNETQKKEIQIQQKEIEYISSNKKKKLSPEPLPKNIQYYHSQNKLQKLEFQIIGEENEQEINDGRSFSEVRQHSKDVETISNYMYNFEEPQLKPLQHAVKLSELLQSQSKQSIHRMSSIHKNSTIHSEANTIESAYSPSHYSVNSNANSQQRGRISDFLDVKNFYRFKKSCLKDKYQLFINENIQIGVVSEFQNSQLQLTLYFKNVAPFDLSNINVQYDKLEAISISPKNVIPYMKKNDQNKQTVTFQTDVGFLTAQLEYRIQGSRKTVKIVIPNSINKLIQFNKISYAGFKRKWKTALNQSIISPQFELDTNIITSTQDFLNHFPELVSISKKNGCIKLVGEGFVHNLGAQFLIKFMINNKNICSIKIILVNSEVDSHENTIRSIMDAYVMILQLQR